MADLFPVDHDPFTGAAAAAPNFIPVDHDPFADAAPAAPTFVPVDHDPFANTAPPSPKLVPVDYDPFIGVAATPAKLVPVGYDPFAAPASEANAPGVSPQANFDRRWLSNSLLAPSNLSLFPPQTDSDNAASAPPSPPTFAPFSPQNLPAFSSPTRPLIFPTSLQFPLAETTASAGVPSDVNASSLGLTPQIGLASPGSSDLPPVSTSGPEWQRADQLDPQPRSSISVSSGRLNSDSTSGQSDSDAANLKQQSLGADTPGSRTRVVYDSAGHVAAIIRVGPAPSGDASPLASDSTPDGLRPGVRYAQINNAISGNPTIDRTTDILLDVLQQTVEAMGVGSGPYFGTSVHTEFAKRVKQLDLPGIGMDGVEQSWNLGRVVPYASASSIRTDILLKDTKDPFQRPIAVYDLKTGYAFLQPPRVKRILDAVNTPGVWVIELQYRTISAINRLPSKK
jgi:hypothetical protein